MRCVADELTLTGGRFLQSGEHLVHGRRQPVDLVARTGSRDPPAELIQTDRVDLAPDLLDRSERATDQPPHRDGEDRDGGRDGQDQHRDQRVDGIAHVVDVLTDDDEAVDAIDRVTAREHPVKIVLDRDVGMGARHLIAARRLDDCRPSGQVVAGEQDAAVGIEHLYESVLLVRVGEAGSRIDQCRRLDLVGALRQRAVEVVLQLLLDHHDHDHRAGRRARRPRSGWRPP